MKIKKSNNTNMHWVEVEVRLVSYHNITRCHNTEDGSSMDLRNIGILPQHCMVSQLRRSRLDAPFTLVMSIRN